MSGTRAGRGRAYLCALVAMIFVFALSVEAAAQLHLPKIPKIGKSETTAQKNTTNGPLPEVTGIEPNSASPGAEGDLTLTGKNFTSGTKLRISCHNTSPEIKSLKVEGPTKMVVHVRFPFQVDEGVCEIYIEAHPGASDETGASSPGTLEVVQVKTVSFTIAASSAMPMCIPVFYLAEGNMDFMALMMKMQQAMQGSWDNSGKPLLCVSKKEVKLDQGEKVIFTEPASNVKDVGEMSMGGQSVGIFRIVFTDGKIHNFMAGDNGAPKGKIVEVIKTAVGK